MTLFNDQKRSCSRVKHLLDRKLEQATRNAGVEDVESLSYKEVILLRTYKDLYEAKVPIITAVNNIFDQKILNGTDELQFQQHYSAMTKLLQNMEAAMRKVLDMPPDEISEMFEEAKCRVMTFLEILSQHKMKITTAVAGVAGAALLHESLAHVCSVALSLRAPACSCASLGYLLAGGLSAGCAFLLILAGIAAYKHFYPSTTVDGPPELTPVPRCTVENVKTIAEELNQKVDPGEILKDLLKAVSLWDHLTINNFNPQTDTDSCPICLDLPPKDPVRFPGCSGRHFHCYACLKECMDGNHFSCSICRQPWDA